MSALKKFLVHPTNSLAVQFLRYAVVGGVAFVVDFAVYVSLTEWAGLHYLVSAAVGFLCGLTTNYALSISWVFQNRSLKDARVEFAVFATIGVVGLGLTEGIMYLATEFVGFRYWISKLIAVALVLFWNFGARKVTLFRAGP